MQRLYIHDLMKALQRTPGRELPHRMQIRPSRIHIPNVGREVFNEPFRHRHVRRIQRRDSPAD
jgi:hypothetical protein